jgi:hypothetical protein
METTKGTALEQAEGALKTAVEAHEAESARVTATKQAIAEFCDRIKTVDPDGDELLVLADQRSAARAKLEALEERVLAAAKEVEAARESCRVARLDAMKDQLQEHDAELRVDSDAILTHFAEFVDSLGPALEAHQGKIREGNNLETMLRKLDGRYERFGSASGPRTSRIGFLSLTDTRGALEALYLTLVGVRLQREKAEIEARSAAARREREAAEVTAMLEQQAEEARRAESARERGGPPVLAPACFDPTKPGMVSDY